MTSFERLKEQVKDQEDKALVQTVEYLVSRKEMEQRYLNEDKTLDGMVQFIRGKGTRYLKNGWNYITNEVVYSWAIMYFSLPDAFLQIENKTTSKVKNKEKTSSPLGNKKNNVIPLENAKKNIEKKKEVEQISLFGGVAQ